MQGPLFAIFCMLGLTLLGQAKHCHDDCYFIRCRRYATAGIICLIVSAVLFGRLTV